MVLFRNRLPLAHFGLPPPHFFAERSHFLARCVHFVVDAQHSQNYWTRHVLVKHLKIMIRSFVKLFNLF
jgi:hypothetical protein